jgi:hypothetical protein
VFGSSFCPVRLAYQPPASSTFLSQQTSHQQPASSTLLSEQTSNSHQPTEQAVHLCLARTAQPGPYRPVLLEQHACVCLHASEETGLIQLAIGHLHLGISRSFFPLYVLGPTHSHAPREPGSAGTATRLVFLEPGRRASAAHAQPGWEGAPGNQTDSPCTRSAWPTLVQDTKHPQR